MTVTETVSTKLTQILTSYYVLEYQYINKLKITLFMAREEILVHSHNQKSHKIGII